MPALKMQEEGLTKEGPVPPTALGQVPLKPLPQVLEKAVSPPPGPGGFRWKGVPTCVHG